MVTQWPSSSRAHGSLIPADARRVHRTPRLLPAFRGSAEHPAHTFLGSHFHASGHPLNFRTDFVLGLKSSRVRQWALLLRASCDFPLPVDPHGAGDEGLEPELAAGIQDYLLACAQTHPRGVALAPGTLRASEEMAFIKGFRNAYLAPHCRYIQLFDSIVNTVNERGGLLYFTLEQVDCFQHFSARAAIELERGRSQPGYTFARYIDEHTMGSRAGHQADRLPHASVTSVEWGSLLEPQGRHHHQAVRFLRDDGTLLDTAFVRELYEQAAIACSSPENMKHLERTGLFSEAARRAVARLQEHVHGRGDMLPAPGPMPAVDHERQRVRLRFGMPSDGLYAIGEE